MKKQFYETQAIPNTLLLGVYSPFNKTANIDSYFDEFLSLAKTNGEPTDNTLFIKIRTIDPTYYLTSGKLEEVKDACEKLAIERIIISESLSAQQERNLEDYLECTITDRTRLILEIFEKAAHSAEGKTQVAIAMLQHEKSRLSGKGKHLSQQAGFTGVRSGPGETLKERERRFIENSIFQHKKELAKLQKTRHTQRKRRLESNLPLICLIGYTNVGKSTILNKLTKSNVLAEDKLFATLDTTTRELYVNSEKIGLLSDTVGFIQNLPTQLIEAFKSTLAELEFADLLLHVIDISDSNWEEHIDVVRRILADLNVDKEVLYVFNKVDKLDDIDHQKQLIKKYQPHVVISAQTKEGLAPLLTYLHEWHKYTTM